MLGPGSLLAEKGEPPRKDREAEGKEARAAMSAAAL